MIPTTWMKIVSVALTAGFAAGAVALGAGVPLSPQQIARNTERAADNVAVAEKNTSETAESTEAFAEIARNVASQVESSKDLLEIQLRLESSSEDGPEQARAIAGSVRTIERALRRLLGRLETLTSLSERTTSSAEESSAAARRLKVALDRLKARFDVVVKESRELNRKARAFDRLRGGS